MMKVLHFGRFFRPSFGGIERHVDLLLSALKDEIHVDNLVANDRFATETIAPHGYPVYQIASLGTLASTALCPTMPWWARKLHRIHAYDIVHLHFPDPLAHLAFSCIPSRVKLVISWHSDIVRQRKLLRLYRPFLKDIIERADAIIAATPRHFSSSTQLERRYEAKFHVVPYGLDYSPFSSAAAPDDAQRIRRDFPGKTLVFAVGRHVYYKGFDHLIRALEHTKNVHLLLGGEGPLTDELQALARRRGLGDRVTFLGRIPEKALAAHYHAADIVCLPSIEPSEAFGLVQLEAMACKKPVISCELNNGVTYVNQHGVTGLVVPPGDSPALAAAINGLAVDPERRRYLGEAGRLRATEEFSLEKMKRGTLRIYEQLINARSLRDTL